LKSASQNVSQKLIHRSPLAKRSPTSQHGQALKLLVSEHILRSVQKLTLSEKRIGYITTVSSEKPGDFEQEPTD
jgi:hypothetical protein